MSKNGNVSAYVKALQNGHHYNTAGLYGRIIRGRKPADFLSLSDDPNRKLVMLMGADGLDKILGCDSTLNMFEAIGYEPSYIVRRVTEGHQFKLIVYPKGTHLAHLATWDGVINALAMVYPYDIVQKVKIQLPGLKKLYTPAYQGWTDASFVMFEHRAGYDFSEVDKCGPQHPRFMTEERYRASLGNLLDTRAFLYFSCHLKEQFAGDGFTYDNKGQRWMREYFYPNTELAKLGDYALVDLHVDL